MTANHEGLTRMLFVDAVVGLGFPHEQVGIDAMRGGLATRETRPWGLSWAWDRMALDNMPLGTLQELYTSLKFYEVTHAG